MVIELTAKSAKVDRFIKLMQPFGIAEIARTGAVALERDSDN
jgi:acetolactate synthase-1/3 small subunit